MADGNSSKTTKAFEVVASIKADLTGFKKGVKEMIQDLKNLSGQAGNIKIGEGLDFSSGKDNKSFSEKSAENENLGAYLEKLGNSIQDIANRLEETANKGNYSENSKDVSELTSINNEIKNVISEVENKLKTQNTESKEFKEVGNIQSQLKSVSENIEKKIYSSGNSKDVSELTNVSDSIKKIVTEVENKFKTNNVENKEYSEVGNLHSQLKSMSEEIEKNISSSGNQKDISLTSVNNDIKKVVSEIENKFKTQNTENKESKGVDYLHSQLKNISEEIEKRISDSGKDSKIEKSNPISGDFKNFSSQLKNIGQSMKQVADSLKKGMGSKSNIKDMVNTSEADNEVVKKSFKERILGFKESISQFKDNPKEFISNRVASAKQGIKNTFSPENMKNGVQGMIQRMKGFNEQMQISRNHGENFTKIFSHGIPDGIRTAQSSLDKLGNALKMMFTLYAGKKLFDFTLGQGMEFEKYQVAFENIYKGDKGKAKAKMEQLTKYADTTNFEIPDVMQAGTILGSVGMNDDKWLKLAGELASYNAEKGTTIQDTSRVMTNIYTGNYGMAREQLREYKINDTLLAQNGVRIGNNGEWNSNAETIRVAVEKAIMQQAGGKTAQMGQTSSGMLSTIHDNLMGVGRDISTKLFDDYKSGIKEVLDLLNELSKNGQLKAFAYSVANALKPAIDGFKNLITWIGKCVQSGKSLTFFAYVSTFFRVLGIVIKSIITIIKDFINIVLKISRALSSITGGVRNTSAVLYQLVSAFVAVKLAMIAFRNQAMITGFMTGLITLFKTLKNVIMGTTSAVEILKLAFKALSSGSWVGLLITVVSSLLFVLMQMQSVKDAIGGLLNKLGLGQLAGILGLDPTNQQDDMDKMIAQAKKQMDDDAKKAQDDANKPPDPNANPNVDDDPYKGHGVDLAHDLEVAEGDIDKAIKKQELKNEIGLQDLTLKGKYTDSGEYLKEDRSGLKALLGKYQNAMEKMNDIISQATRVEDKDTKNLAQMKLMEYTVKANELLTQIANNTNDLKNIIEMNDLRNSNDELKKDVDMQEYEIKDGVRDDTYAYWMKNREWLKKLMNDAQNSYEAVKAKIPSLEGKEKIEAENKALEYHKKANELLLEIKKNTDPRNGTFNLPSGIRAYSLFEDRQANGKSGMVVSGNNFLIQVKELIQQEQVQDLMDRIQEAIYERTASDVRR